MPRPSAAVPAEIILLDLPDTGGAAERRNGSGRVPVIMLARRHGSWPWPGDPQDLAALIGTALAAKATNDRSPHQPLRFGRTWLNLEAARLTAEDGREIPLTAMEFDLLRLFARNRGRVLSRDQILEGAHDRRWDPFDRSIDIRISRIRRKIEVNPAKPEAIRTVRGIGYIYDAK